jgi:hypothetical protein
MNSFRVGWVSMSYYLKDDFDERRQAHIFGGAEMTTLRRGTGDIGSQEIIVLVTRLLQSNKSERDDKIPCRDDDDRKYG